MKTELRDLLDECVRTRGPAVVEAALRSLLGLPQAEENTLTIVANTGVHQIPQEYLRGEVYSASHGNWQASTQIDLEREVRSILLGLARKLKERPWRRVYLVPTGHPVVAMNIKVLVYRVLRMNTMDVVYLNGRYFDLALDQREVALGA